jgi:hypothetical protein
VVVVGGRCRNREIKGAQAPIIAAIDEISDTIPGSAFRLRTLAEMPVRELLDDFISLMSIP